MIRFMPCFCLLALLGPSLHAGEPAAQLQKTVLSGENKDSLAELLVADRLVHPKQAPQRLAGIIGLGNAGPLGPVPAMALERISRQQWAEAMEEYQRLIDEEGDNLVPVGSETGPSRRSVQLRRLCHMRMAAAPPSALAQHQKRVEALADKLFHGGKDKRTLQALERLGNDLFCSRPAGPALELLGDLAFERGDFAKAQSWWRMLVLPVSEKETGTTLLVPSGPADPARIRAKQIMAVAFLGEPSRAEAELKAFQRRHPKAQGRLAGKDGLYATIVAEVIRNLPREEAVDDPWTTFAGSPTRNRISTGSPSDRWWADGPTWRVSLFSEKDLVPLPGSKRPLRFHPVIVEDKVLITDERTVTAYHLLTGKEVFRYDPFAAGPGPGADRANDAFTLTVSKGRIYARLTQPKRQGGKSYLVCLDMIQDKNKVQARERWRVQAKDFEFEGSPLVHNRLAFIAQTASADKRTRTSLACYDALTGKLRWLQEICDTPDQGGPRGSNLLTLADSQVVYCSQSGAIVAVDSGTGKPKWGIRYVSRGRERKDGFSSPRDLCPPLAADGRLFIAPADTDRVFCLDALTGRTLWDRGGIEVVHLLGVARGRLILTTPHGLKAIMADTGLDQGGWMKPDVGTLPPMGRGILAGNWVFWPTRNRNLPLRAVTLDQGEQEDMDPNRLRLLEPGNMALGNGCLVVAGPDELVGYVSPRRLLEQRQTQVNQPPASLQSLYLLAQSQAEAGLYDLALVNFGRLAGSPLSEQWQGRPIQTLALERRHALLLQLALRAEKQATPRWQQAAEFFKQAAGPEFPVPARLLANIRLAELWDRAGQPQKAVGAWQGILLDEKLRESVFFSRKRSPQLAAVLARTGIQKLIDQHGAAAYADFEIEAKEAYTKARGSVPLLDKLVRAYPNASVTPAALSDLARQEEKAGRFAAAAQAYRLFLQGKPADPVPGLIGLAKAYEKQQCFAGARATWMLLAKNFGDRQVQSRRVRDLAADQLRKSQYQDDEKKLSGWSGPLVQRWTCSAGDLLLPARNALSANPQAVFLAHVNRLSCREAVDGKERWERTLPFTPTWVGLHADLLVTAGKQGIAALRLEDGQLVWTLEPRIPDHSFSGFQLTEAQIFFLDREQRLLAVELETGRVAWSQWAPGALLQPLGGGGFSPHYLATADWALVQSSAGRRLVFQAVTGKRLHESPAAGPWSQDPQLLDEQRLCLVENTRVLVLDTGSWKELWTYAPSWSTSWTGEPVQVTKDAKSCFVLIPRNYGFELDRLDPRTGKSLWQQPSLLARDPVDVRTISFADDCFYYVGDGELTCRSLADGKRLWHKPLAGKSRHWQTLRFADAVVAYPAEDVQPPWLWLPLGNMLLAWPTSHDVRSRTLPVSCHRAKDGELLQRLDFTEAANRIEIQLFLDRLVVGGARNAWGFTPSEKR